MITITYDTLIFVLTLTATSAYAVLAWVFLRIPGNRVMRALMWYFVAMCAVYAAAITAEGPFGIALGNEWWAEWRALFFRGAQAVASVWLLVVISRKP